MQVQDGLLNGFAGCNDYRSAVGSGPDGLNSLVVYPAAVTRSACSDEITNQETAFLARLDEALSWWYDAGRLVFTYPLGNDQFGALVFESLADSAGVE